MNKIFFTLTLLFPLFVLSQQKISYDTKQDKIEFNISSNEYYVEFLEGMDTEVLKKVSEIKFSSVFNNSALVTNDEIKSSIFEDRKNLLNERTKGMLKEIYPVLLYQDSTKQICTGELIVKTTANISVENIFEGYTIDITPDKFVENQYIIKLHGINTLELFKLVTKLKEFKTLDFIEPKFIRLLKPNTNDPFFNSQWAIKNLGYLGGTSGADMNVESAWTISTGQNIKIAIIDEGVELNHPDLAANLLTGYDATGNGSLGGPNLINNDAHGTACAGIIAAVANNNIGVTGVAYNSKIIPIRIAYSNGAPLGSGARNWITNDSWIANGITWAKNSGADILSNSWGGGSPSTIITNAINDAVNNGRNGKGCIVLVSTGNGDSYTIAYPSSLNNVIGVSASSMCDTRKTKTPISCDGENWGGNYGLGLDLIAPGVKIYTTDIAGINGYSTGDYKSDFNGTSSACPNAAGVVALMLSANPNLTGQQARNILETTCDKVGGYSYQSGIPGQPNGTWSSDAGYGRVNACKAVGIALATTLNISGLDFLCTGSDYTLNVPPSAIVTWQSSNTLIGTAPPTGNPVTVTRVGSANGVITLTATVNFCGAITVLPPKQITIGTPAPVFQPLGTICEGDPVTVCANPIPNITSLQWVARVGTSNITLNETGWCADLPQGTGYVDLL